MDEVRRFVGIDVAKAALDVFIGSDGVAFSVTNDEVGIRELLGQLKPTDFVILEATGGLETPVASALATGGIAVAIVNHRQVRDFARATGRLAKTDALDAKVLARFGEAVRPQARPLADEQAQALEALVTRRRQLVEMLTAEKNRRANAPKVLHRSIDEHIRWLEKRLSGFDDGVSATNCCVPYRVSARCFRVLCSPTCPSWAHLIANRLPLWPDWRRLTVTAEPCAAAVVSGAGAPRSDASCTWLRWPAFAAIRSSKIFTPSCVRAGNILSQRSPPACASSS